MMTPPEFHQAVMLYCARLSGSVQSYGRTAKRNAAVGGAKQSGHLYWLGCDVVYDEGTPIPGLQPPGYLVDAQLAVDTGERLGLRVLREEDHDHLQPLEWRRG